MAPRVSLLASQLTASPLSRADLYAKLAEHDDALDALDGGAIGGILLAATVAGRALIAAGYFDAATLTAKVAVGGISVPLLNPMIASGIQALNGAGAIDLVTSLTNYTSTGGAQALTLADSTVTGQDKTIVHVVDGGSGVITAGGALHLAAGIATITLANAWDWISLKWTGALWTPTGWGGSGLVIA